MACALQVLASLNLWDEKIFFCGAASLFLLAGRMEKIIKNDRQWIFDVAHNAAGAKYLAQQLKREGIHKVALVFSAMADKDIVSVLAALKPILAQCILFPLQGNTRAASVLAAGLVLEKRNFRNGEGTRGPKLGVCSSARI